MEPVGLGLGRLERGHHLLRLRPLRRPRRGRRRRARRAERQHLAGHLERRRRPAARPDRPGHRPARRRRRPAQTQPGHLDRARRGHDAGAVHRPRRAGYLWIALVLLAAGAVFSEFAGVSYNAMLPQVSTPETVGRISGFGWSMGYFGGIVLLLVCYVGFIAPDVGWFGVTSEGGLNIRTLARVLRRLVRAVRPPGAVRGPGEAARPGPASGQLLRLLPAAGRRREEPVRPRPQLGVLPDRLGALPRRPGRGLLLRRHPGRQRLRHGHGHRAHLRHRGQCDRRARCAGARSGRGPGRRRSGSS